MQLENLQQNELQNAVLQTDKKKYKKSAKNQKSIPLDDEVVYTLINSVNWFSSIEQNNLNENKVQNIVQQKIQGQIQVKKQNVQMRPYLILQRNGIKRTDITDILTNRIKPMPFTILNELKMKVKSALGKVYLNKKAKMIDQQQLKLDIKKSTEELLNQSIAAYKVLSGLLKQSSITTPIQQGFYQQYSLIWQELIKIILSEQNNKYSQQIHKELQQPQTNKFLDKINKKMLDVWLQIPHQSLAVHLQTFKIAFLFAQIDEYKMMRQLSSLLVQNKIQQCCTYYEIYCQTKYTDLLRQKISNDLRQFQDETLIPKITKSDHIFASHVLSLLKTNTQLKERLLNSVQLDPSVGAKVVDLLKQDGHHYYNIYKYVLKQHYKSVVYDYNYWYMVQDKLSFSKNFIEWYVEDLIEVMKGNKEHQQLKKIAQQMKGVHNIEDLQLSILQRNQVIDFQHSKYKGKQFERIQNPLYVHDRFDCTELVIQDIVPQEKQLGQTIKYLRFQEYGVEEKDIKFISAIDQSFNQMWKTLLEGQNKIIGFDTQFRCTSSKYQQQGVSLIQLSTRTHHYIIDFLKIENQPQFKKFIIDLLCNDKYIKVGHTISSDIKFLTLTLQIPPQLKIQSFIDIAHIFKLLYPNEKYSSLSFFCLKYLDRKLAKYEQRSNWNRRPLKKTQLHYAALDAFACVLVYEKMQVEHLEYIKNGKPSKNIILSKPGFVFSKQPQNILIQFKNQEEQTSQVETIKTVVQNEVPKNEGKYVGDIYRSDNLLHHRKYKQLISSAEPKFLVDNMLKKLSSILRNCGLDAEYIAVRDYVLATELAQKQERIILTRDTKFFQRKDNKIPIYLIKQRTDCDKMFDQVAKFFNINLANFKTLSRCVKCNGPQLIIIPAEEALNQVKFRYQQNVLTQFWRCTKCKQIYWQGGQFVRAKQKYGNLKKMQQKL